MHLIIGAENWDHSQWSKEYYPEDLPADWRLDYYANEFDALLISQATYQAATPEDVHQWLNDALGLCELFIDVSENSGSALKQTLKQRLADVVLVEFRSASRLNEFPEISIEQATVIYPENWSADQIILRLSADRAFSAFETRTIIENITQEYGKAEIAYLFFKSALLNMNFLNQLRIISDLL